MPVAARFRWLSLYYKLLQAAHRSRLFLLLAQLLAISLFLSLFALIPLAIQPLLLTRRNPLSIGFAFLLLVVLIDLYSLLFLRTRTSLKFFPATVFPLLYAFLLYLNCNSYCFDVLALCALYSLTLLLMSVFLLSLEAPACRSWDQRHPQTPRVRAPRLLFNPVFSLAWMHDAPPLWTLFLPLFGRAFFDRRHLAFVDNEVHALDVYREAASNGENNLFAFEERHLAGLAGFSGDDVRYRL